MPEAHAVGKALNAKDLLSVHETTVGGCAGVADAVIWKGVLADDLGFLAGSLLCQGSLWYTYGSNAIRTHNEVDLIRMPVFKR